MLDAFVIEEIRRRERERGRDDRTGIQIPDPGAGTPLRPTTSPPRSPPPEGSSSSITGSSRRGAAKKVDGHADRAGK